MTPPKLHEIKKSLLNKNSIEPVSVREFLSWFGAKRRGLYIVDMVYKSLDEVGLITIPDFNDPWLDGFISFHLKNSCDSVDNDCILEGNPVDSGLASENKYKNKNDIGYRVSRLAAANKGVVSVKPGADIKSVVTLMLMNDYSQIAVMQDDRNVKGIVSWASIGAKLMLSGQSDKLVVNDFMASASILDHSDLISEAIRVICDKGFILVRGPEKNITGIVTASDLSFQLQNFSEPFLILGEIEFYIRNIIDSHFQVEEVVNNLRGDRGRQIENLSDMTFGDYIFFLQNPHNWGRLGMNIDRVMFCEKLNEIRIIRNQVMHFDPDGLEDDQMESLKEFFLFLKKFHEIII